jgi:hypothetical protein
MADLEPLGPASKSDGRLEWTMDSPPFDDLTTIDGCNPGEWSEVSLLSLSVPTSPTA